ncbi:hypothetical protein ACH4SP_11610 [Streptomyces sp. NPDC021093]|uniref:hypothetical protein n=1 Tax=Streptomyces sp. NPDC021093 TaxID=3365112 RepID=UPI00379C0E2C
MPTFESGLLLAPTAVPKAWRPRTCDGRGLRCAPTVTDPDTCRTLRRNLDSEESGDSEVGTQQSEGATIELSDADLLAQPVRDITFLFKQEGNLLWMNSAIDSADTPYWACSPPADSRPRCLFPAPPL